MAQQLTKGVFGNPFAGQSGTALFGLHCGQTCESACVHRGGWYNRDGERLGWGDLNLADFQRIAEGLQEDEFFIILGERDSFMNVIKRLDLDNPALVKPTIEVPGVDYVAKKAVYVIGPKELYYIVHHDSSAEATIGGLTFRVLKDTEVKTFLARHQMAA